MDGGVREQRGKLSMLVRKMQCGWHTLKGRKQGRLSLGCKCTSLDSSQVMGLAEAGLSHASDTTAIVERPDRAYNGLTTNKSP